jgi:hypothetical protein
MSVIQCGIKTKKSHPKVAFCFHADIYSAD